MSPRKSPTLRRATAARPTPLTPGQQKAAAAAAYHKRKNSAATAKPRPRKPTPLASPLARKTAAATAKPRPRKPAHSAAPRPRKLTVAAVPTLRDVLPEELNAEAKSADKSRARALGAVAAALEKKAENPTVLEVRGISSYADYVVLLGADSVRQVEAIGQAIVERLRTEGVRAIGIEGRGNSEWMLLDFGDVVIHVFFRDARHFYDLEGLWAEAPRVRIPVPERLD